MKERVYKYLLESFKRNRWPYIAVMQIKNEFGDIGVDALNELRKEGRVVRREGANGPLIEITDNDILEIEY